ncbi:unnamed protein product [Brassicogethes aeneus]|uniref:RING-type E3 ubiquitin transferase n=1 Tax=Brassicogethes aeneus TaxID=1431903 RepID=A0A9P0BFY8_BRAAE|nr:unnamed protein product [Brassicogethes aeneus]
MADTFLTHIDLREFCKHTNLPSTSSQSNNNKYPEKKQPSNDAEKALIDSVIEAQQNIDTRRKQSSSTDSESPKSDKNESSASNEESEGACASPPLKPPPTPPNLSWANAPEFVPRVRSYAQALHPNAGAQKMDKANCAGGNPAKLCPYVNKDGVCRNLTSNCAYLHGEMCDMCERLVLHPYNEELRKKHRQECIQQHEKNMELSFAIARSKEKSCGVCFEVIMEKATGEQRFGILPNCNHCFCLTCIRKWRQARQFENKIIRACPECRVTSDFVCPSMYWVDTKEDKEKLIDDYKKALSKKDCKYFKRGQGKCPFGNKCFYLHAFPDGSKCDVGPPPRQRRFHGFDTSDIEVLQQVMLWEILDESEFPWTSLDDIEDLVSFFTDSDESDWSDYDLFFD